MRQLRSFGQLEALRKLKAFRELEVSWVSAVRAFERAERCLDGHHGRRSLLDDADDDVVVTLRAKGSRRSDERNTAE